MTLSFICIFILGLIIGSFLNVVIYRYNTGRSVVFGRSHCGSCGATLQWYELIPVVSYILQKGGCRTCGSRLSVQYPLVELATGLVFLAMFQKFAVQDIALSTLVTLLLYYTVQWSLLLVIFVYDLRHKIIPEMLVIVFTLLALGHALIQVPEWKTLIAGPLVAAPLFLIWLFSGGRWMGFGDVKLSLGIGWFLGISSGFASLILAFWIGAAIALIILAFQRGKMTMKSEIPFAPFLIMGIGVAFFKDVQLTDIINIFNFLS